jgi:subtilisin family serine protease
LAYLALSLLMPPLHQASGSSSDRVELRLRSGAFDPLRETPARLLRAQPEALRSLTPPDDLVLIQFTGPPRPEWLATLRTKDGAAIFNYVPQHAYLGRLAPEARIGVIARPFVRAVIPYLPAFRFSPGLLPTISGHAGADDAAAENAVTERVRLLIKAAPDHDSGTLERAIAIAAPRAISLGGGHPPGAQTIAIEIDRAALPGVAPRLASLPEVFWVEERLPFVAHNSEMKWVLQTGAPASTRFFSLGLNGNGQIIGESDSGVDVAHCFFDDPLEAVTFELIDPDNPPVVPVTNPAHRKVLAYQYHSDSDQLDLDGHGTHVAGTALGDDLTNPAGGTDPGLDPFDGMAPAARLLFQDVDKQGGFLDIPLNLYGFLQGAYAAGARVHTNSWGSATDTYKEDSSQVDRFMWDHPDILFLFSNGNRGPDPGTVGAPASAKNVVSVGMVDSPASGDPNNLVADSSNGPTSDGRMRPVVVNVGGFPIQSAEAGTACGLVSFFGTSMATPGVAGGATLLRQYLVDGWYPHGYAGSGPQFVPSAALLKAFIVNSAVNISGNNVDGPIPDNSQGWGRVRLDDAAFFAGDDRRLLILHDDDLGSTADGFPVGAVTTDSFSLFNCRTDLPIKITLAWTEPSVASTSGQAWVNDLNLEVEAPDGIVYRGNVFSNGVSTTGGTPDDRNNLEQVLLTGSAVQSGTYTVRITPTDVAVGPQPYALLATGDVSTSPLPALTVTATTRVDSCDADLYLDENERMEITYTVQNNGCGDSSPFEALLTSGATLPAAIDPPSISLAALPAGSSDTAAFNVALEPGSSACGATLPLLLRLETANGARWEVSDEQLLALDPITGSRFALDDVESGDLSLASDPAWQIDGCAVAGGSASWHLGESDCSGIPRDASPHSLEFSLPLAPGEDLTTASFVHAFDGYMNATFADSIHFEIDHDLDGSYIPIASWVEGGAPTTMTSTGTFDLSSFNSGRAASEVRFRFRFQSAASWVGGPNDAAGWSIDDFRVDVDIFAGCDVPTPGMAPGDVGNALTVVPSGADALLSWSDVSDASSYRIMRSENPDLSSAETFWSPVPSYVDTGALSDPRSFYYEVLAISGCGTLSAD